MASLTELAYQVAHSFERGTDLLFIERIKDLLINERSMLIHREIDKYGINEQYLQPYTPTLIRVNASESPILSSNREVLRTTLKIPTPVRFQGDVPFYFVGSPDRLVTYRYNRGYMLDFDHYLKFIGSGITYAFTNNYLYILNNIKIESILIEAIYNNLGLTNDLTLGICYDEHMEFPLTTDLQNTVMLGVINILRNGNDIKEKAPTATRDLN